MGFDWNQPADDADGRGVRSNAQFAAKSTARMAVQTVELETEPDDHRLASPDVQPVEVGRDLRADRHELSGQAAEQTLDTEEEQGGDSSEVPVEHVTVERMHPDGDPRQSRGQPAD